MKNQISIFFLSFLLLTVAYAQEKKVKLETPFGYVKKNGKLVLERSSYLDFRPAWGIRLSFSTAEMSPTAPLLEQDGKPIQVNLSLNKNFKKLSFGLEAGYLKASWNNDISIEAFSVGLVGRLDGVFKTPYAVPYFKVGILDIDAEIGEAVIDTEGLVLSYSFGMLFTLNWIDKTISEQGYSDLGLLNTYLYFGMRKISETHSNPDLNLETEMYPEFGLQLEF